MSVDWETVEPHFRIWLKEGRVLLGGEWVVWIPDERYDGELLVLNDQEFRRLYEEVKP